MTGRQRVGIAFPGDPTKRSTWSGTPLGVMEGLTTCGVEPVPLRIEPSPLIQKLALNLISVRYLRVREEGLVNGIRTARQATRNSPELARLGTWAAPRRIRDAGPLDGIIQIGTGYELPSGAPVVTYEDMTVRQVRAQPYPGWERLSARALASKESMQATAYERAVAVCMTSQWAARSAVSDYHLPTGKVHVVGVGQNHTLAPSVTRDWTVPRFLFIGTQWERKNGPAVLRAFAQLRAEVPGATLDVIGGHPRLDAPGVSGHGPLRLDVPDESAQVARLFATSTCFVMPSLSEAAGISYVEAGAAGLPSIGTTAGGSAFLIGDGGLVVDPTDEGAILQAMQTLAVARNASRMGDEAHARSSLFTWPLVARRLLAALNGARADFTVE